jgi:hypothetical protein
VPRCVYLQDFTIVESRAVKMVAHVTNRSRDYLSRGSLAVFATTLTRSLERPLPVLAPGDSIEIPLDLMVRAL